MRVEIVKNSAMCKDCKDILTSRYRHDFQMCSCGNLAVDGGHDYIKRSVKDSDRIIDLSKVIHHEN